MCAWLYNLMNYNTHQQGYYGNIKDNYHFKLMLVCWFQTWTHTFLFTSQFFVFNFGPFTLLYFRLSAVILLVRDSVRKWCLSGSWTCILISITLLFKVAWKWCVHSCVWDTRTLQGSKNVLEIIFWISFLWSAHQILEKRRNENSVCNWTFTFTLEYRHDDAINWCF
jgi:hypothetical protein